MGVPQVRLVGGAIAAAVLIVGLAGCAAEPAPAPSDTGPVVESPTPSGEPEPDPSADILFTITANVRAVDLRITYDPALLSITGATVGPGVPGGATVVANTNTPGLAIFVFFSSTALSAGNSTILDLQAAIPASS